MGGSGKSTGSTTPTTVTVPRVRGEGALFDLMRAKNYDALPKVVGAKEFQALAVQSEYPVLFRGFGAKDETVKAAYMEQLRSGEFFTSKTVNYGEGLYAAGSAINPRYAAREARYYASAGVATKIEMLAFKKGTKLADFYDLQKQWKKANPSAKLREFNPALEAVRKGFAGLRVKEASGPNVDYYIILDRSSLIVKR